MNVNRCSKYDKNMIKIKSSKYDKKYTIKASQKKLNVSWSVYVSEGTSPLQGIFFWKKSFMLTKAAFIE